MSRDLYPCELCHEPVVPFLERTCERCAAELAEEECPAWIDDAIDAAKDAELDAEIC